MRTQPTRHESRPFGAGLLDPEPALAVPEDVPSPPTPADADAPAEADPWEPDPADAGAPRLGLADLIDREARAYAEWGNEVGQLLSLHLTELAMSIRFHRAESVRQYLESEEWARFHYSAADLEAIDGSGGHLAD